MTSRACKPLSALSGPISALFTDLDGTLTTDGRVSASTYHSIHRLADSGVPVVLVTGRSAGWGQALASLGPFEAVIAENGGITYYRTKAALATLYGLDEVTLPEWRARMRDAVDLVLDSVPGVMLSSDSRFRVVDLAIDWNEEVHAAQADAERVVEILRRGGFEASRSSVHINFAPPVFDKLTATEMLVERVLGARGVELASSVFVGDAPNDAPMFGGFAHSVGVANAIERWDELDPPPQYLTEAPGGAGLCQVVDRILELNAPR